MNQDKARKVLDFINTLPTARVAVWRLGGSHGMDEVAAIMREEEEPISDAEIVALWHETPRMSQNEEAIYFARALLEKK